MTEPTANASENDPPPDVPKPPPIRPPTEFDTVLNHRDPRDVEYRDKR
jgi:hypothetical protein